MFFLINEQTILINTRFHLTLIKSAGFPPRVSGVSISPAGGTTKSPGAAARAMCE
jgi:hypothetical protein